MASTNGLEFSALARLGSVVLAKAAHLRKICFVGAASAEVRWGLSEGPEGEGLWFRCLVDWLMHHAEAIVIRGDNYRMHDKNAH